MEEANKKKRPISFKLTDVAQIDYSGTTIWLCEDKLIWIQAKVLEQNGKNLKIQRLHDSAITDIDLTFEEVHRLNPKVVSDMAGLNFIHEPGILWNLIQRALSGSPYTYMGTVMIAVNPLRTIESPKTIDYIDKPLNPDTPHPYALAELAYQQLCFSHVNQCLVVSGESGAGKTETAKILLKFLADRSQTDSKGDVSDMNRRMLQSSPLLESFGNAKTGRNNNSSRFGKLLKMYFKRDHLLAPSVGQFKDAMIMSGVAIETYLLEISRVVGQNIGERNYHIFYQLLSAFTSADNSTGIRNANLNLSSNPDDYRILSNSKCVSFEGCRDHFNFKVTHESLLTFGIQLNDVYQIYKILAGLLHMGNISFKDEDTEAGYKSVITDRKPLEAAAAALGVPVAQLECLITTRQLDVTAHGTESTFTVRLTTKEACYACDSCIKSLYDKLFKMIVRRINRNLCDNEKESFSGVRNTKLAEDSFISILDIYGFETFEVNTFEQFLINYANESLQNTFNVQIFDAELKIFAEENITCHITSQPENNGCIEMIAGKSQSIIAILDSICELSKPSDERFIDELHKHLGKNRYFPPVHVKERHKAFYVKHFAGNIKYTVGVNDRDNVSNNSESYTWVSKNNDSPPDGLKSLCEQSSLNQLILLYESSSTTAPGAVAVNSASSSPERNRITSVRKKMLIPSTEANKNTTLSHAESSPRENSNQLQVVKTSVAASFSYSMYKLSSLLVSTNCLFVRCIKPNIRMEPEVMENDFIVHQLRSLGVLQTCEVLKLGMPTRLPYHELMDALKPIISKLPPSLVNATEQITLIACILYAFNVTSDLYRLGRTRIFFRAGQFELIDRILKTPKESFDQRSKQIIERIHQAAEFKKEADKMARDLNEIIKSKQQGIANSRIKVLKAIDQINNAPPNEIEVPPEMTETLLNCDRLFNTTKTALDKAVDKGNKAIAACSQVQNSLDVPGTVLMNKITADTTSVHSRFLKVSAKHSRTTTRFDALRGRHDRVKEVANSLEDILQSAEHLVSKAMTRIVEIQDGGMRCDLPYAEDRAKSCEDIIQQVSFRLEGVDLDLKEIFEVFGAERTRGGVEIGFRIVKGYFASELKTLEDLNKELKELDKNSDQALALAQSVAKQNSTASDSSTNPYKLASTSELKDLHPDTYRRQPPLPTVTEVSSPFSDNSVSPASSELSPPPPPPPVLEVLTIPSTPTKAPTPIATSVLDETISPPPLLLAVNTSEGAAEIASPSPSPSTDRHSASSPPAFEAAPKLHSPSKPSLTIPTSSRPPSGRFDSNSTHNADPNATSPNQGPMTLNTSNVDGIGLLDRIKSAAKEAEKKLINDAIATGSRPNTSRSMISDHDRPPPSLQSSRLRTSSSSANPLSASRNSLITTPVTDRNSNRVSLRMSSVGSVLTPTLPTPSKDMSPIRRPNSVNLSKSRSSSADLISSKTFDEMGSIAEGEVTEPLPDGWKEYFDSNSKRPYYVHKPTKARQWKRPTSSCPEPTPKRRGSNASDASYNSSKSTSSVVDAVVETDRSSMHFNAEPDRNTIMQMIRADLKGNRMSLMGSRSKSKSISTNGVVDIVVDPAIVARIRAINIETGLNNNYLSVTKMEVMGLETKKGYLMKKSSILGRWRKRWFVLEGGRFEYFDRPQDEAGGNGKQFLLSSRSLTGYTTTQNCFCVKSNEESDAMRHWYLVAKDESEMSSWVMSLSSQIHMLYVQEEGLSIRPDLWGEGVVETAFWRVSPPDSARTNWQNIAIRTLPKTNAPRTGESVGPYEILECVQYLKADFNTYLRLWGDRGWVYEKHPKARYPLMQKLMGEMIEEIREFKNLSRNPLIIRTGPSNENSIAHVPANMMITPGMVFQSMTSWQERYADGRLSGKVFYKLATGGGWVSAQDLQSTKIA